MLDRPSRPRPDRRLPRRVAATLAALSWLVTGAAVLARLWLDAPADADPTALAALARAAAQPVAPRDDPPGWSRVDTGPFSVALPPGWRYAPLQGVDSFVGGLVGDGIELTFDYGAFWNSAPSDASGHDVERTHVDFRAAQIYWPRDASAVLALFIEHTDDVGSFWGPKHLSIVGHDVPPAAHERVVAIFRSVRFRRVIAEGGRWIEVAPPSGPVGLLAVDATAGRGWRVGGVRYQPPMNQALVYELADGAWTEQVLASGDGAAVWSLDGDWAATGSALYRLDPDGQRWALRHTTTTDGELHDVAIDRSRLDEDGWAIGDDGVVRLRSGAAIADDGAWGVAQGWAVDVLARSPLHPPRRTTADALAIGPTGVGAFDGARWAAAAAGSQPVFGLSIDLIAPGEAWIVGARRDEPFGGAIALWRDGVLAMAPITTSTPLWSIDLINPAEGWAVGGGADAESSAELWRFRDGVWERQPPPCDCHLHAVQALPDGTAYAVGMVMSDDVLARRAVVLRYEPGGPTATPGGSATATSTPGGSASATATAVESPTQAAATATTSAVTPSPHETATAAMPSGEARAWLPWAGRD